MPTPSSHIKLCPRYLLVNSYRLVAFVPPCQDDSIKTHRLFEKGALDPPKRQFADDVYDTQTFMHLLYFMFTVKNAPVTLVKDTAQAHMSARQMEASTCPGLILTRLSLSTCDP